MVARAAQAALDHPEPTAAAALSLAPAAPVVVAQRLLPVAQAV
jgi:hypothetical protein